MYAPPKEVQGTPWRDNPQKPYLLCSTCTTWAIPLAVWRAISSRPMSIPCIRAGLSGIILTRPFTGRMWMERRSWDMAGTLGTDPRITPFAGNGIVFADRGEKPAMQEVRYWYSTKRAGAV